MDENIERQKEEIDAISAIYQENCQCEDENFQTYNIRIADGDLIANLIVTLPPEYPSVGPPYYLLNCPWMSRKDKEELSNEIERVAESNIGESVIYQWAEKVREFLQNKGDALQKLQAEETEEEKARKQILKSIPIWTTPCPEIVSSEPFTERKSTFQGHIATVFTQDQVRQVLAKLYENRKIAQATHNIYAYRIYKEDSKSWLQDCDDDGETQAGSRLLHLLQIVNSKDVIVVVSRWFGGILLGADRFKLINNAARQVLQLGGYLEASNDTGKRKNK
ncbi:protein IMPACT-like [Artemia franciscana]|uniref:protein IMPACT-like n=1 Tax=Artemia franciscana TaxID=6661 RepID=UPI0032DB8037